PFVRSQCENLLPRRGVSARLSRVRECNTRTRGAGVAQGCLLGTAGAGDRGTPAVAPPPGHPAGKGAGTVSRTSRWARAVRRWSGRSPPPILPPFGRVGAGSDALAALVPPNGGGRHAPSD